MPEDANTRHDPHDLIDPWVDPGKEATSPEPPYDMAQETLAIRREHRLPEGAIPPLPDALQVSARVKATKVTDDRDNTKEEPTGGQRAVPRHPTSYSSSSRKIPGYMVQWRRKPGATADIWGITDRWAEVLVSPCITMPPPDEDYMQMVRPTVTKYEEAAAKYGVVTALVGTAVVACLKTMIEPAMRGHVEFRLHPVVLRTSHSVEEDVNANAAKAAPV